MLDKVIYCPRICSCTVTFREYRWREMCGKRTILSTVSAREVGVSGRRLWICTKLSDKENNIARYLRTHFAINVRATQIYIVYITYLYLLLREISYIFLYTFHGITRFSSSSIFRYCRIGFTPVDSIFLSIRFCNSRFTVFRIVIRFDNTCC